MATEIGNLIWWYVKQGGYLVRSNLLLTLYILGIVDRASRYIHLKINQLVTQFIFNIFRQTLLHVSAVSIPNQQEEQPYVSNSGYLIFFLDACLLCWLGYFNIKYTLFYTYSCTS
jgi:hypothetical protein